MKNVQERNALAKARAHEPRKQPRHEIRDGAMTWPCGMDASDSAQAWSEKPTAKRKAPAGCIDHAHTHTPGMPNQVPTATGGQAEMKLSEAARALREVRLLTPGRDKSRVQIARRACMQ